MHNQIRNRNPRNSTQRKRGNPNFRSAGENHPGGEQPVPYQKHKGRLKKGRETGKRTINVKAAKNATVTETDCKRLLKNSEKTKNKS